MNSTSYTNPDSHDKLLKCMHEFGYDIDWEGTCNGFAVAAILESFMSKNKEEYKQRLNLIVNSDPKTLHHKFENLKKQLKQQAESEIFSRSSEEIKTNITNQTKLPKDQEKIYLETSNQVYKEIYEKLSASDALLLSLSNYFDTVNFAQGSIRIINHSYLPQDPRGMLDIIQPNSLEHKSGIKFEDRVESILTKNELDTILLNFEQVMKQEPQLQFPTSILFNSDSHASSISYDVESGKWFFADADFDITSDTLFTREEMLTKWFDRHSLHEPNTPVIFAAMQVGYFNDDAQKMRNKYNEWVTESTPVLENITAEKAAYVTPHGLTYLYLAVERGDAETVNRLLEEGANINVEYNVRKIKNNNEENQSLKKDSQYLIEQIDTIETSYSTPLNSALMDNFAHIARLLIDAKDKKGEYLLETSQIANAVFNAIKRGDVEAIEWLNRNNLVQEVRYFAGTTPIHYSLHYAITHPDPKNAAVFQEILSQYSDVNLLDKYQTSPLQMALDSNRFDLAKMLLEKNANCFVMNKEGISSFASAILDNNNLAIECMLPYVNNTSLLLSSVPAPMEKLIQQAAEQNKHAEISSLFDQLDIPIDPNEVLSVNVLHIAAFYGNKELITVLCAKDPSLLNGQVNGLKPRDFASIMGNEDCVELIDKLRKRYLSQSSHALMNEFLSEHSHQAQELDEKSNQIDQESEEIYENDNDHDYDVNDERSITLNNLLGAVKDGDVFCLDMILANLNDPEILYETVKINFLDLVDYAEEVEKEENYDNLVFALNDAHPGVNPQELKLSLLQLAAYFGHDEVVECLLDKEPGLLGDNKSFLPVRDIAKLMDNTNVVTVIDKFSATPSSQDPGDSIVMRPQR